VARLAVLPVRELFVLHRRKSGFDVHILIFGGHLFNGQHVAWWRDSRDRELISIWARLENLRRGYSCFSDPLRSRLSDFPPRELSVHQRELFASLDEIVVGGVVTGRVTDQSSVCAYLEYFGYIILGRSYRGIAVNCGGEEVVLTGKKYAANFDLIEFNRLRDLAFEDQKRPKHERLFELERKYRVLIEDRTAEMSHRYGTRAIVSYHLNRGGRISLRHSLPELGQECIVVNANGVVPSRQLVVPHYSTLLGLKRWSTHSQFNPNQSYADKTHSELNNILEDCFGRILSASDELFHATDRTGDTNARIESASCALGTNTDSIERIAREIEGLSGRSALFGAVCGPLYGRAAQQCVVRARVAGFRSSEGPSEKGKNLEFSDVFCFGERRNTEKNREMEML